MACRAAARKPPLNEDPRRGPNHRRFSFWLKVKIKPQACLRVTRNVRTAGDWNEGPCDSCDHHIIGGARIR